MNARVIVAQANPTSSAPGAQTRVVRVTKPQSGEATTVDLGYGQKAKLDLSGVANERMTLVHIGEKLIILFDNNATVTVQPFFDSMGVPRQDITVEVGPGREMPTSEFAALFPITTDQSVLPAAGDGPTSGANFSEASIDPLSTPQPLPLLGPEELPNFVVDFISVPLLEGEEPNLIPTVVGKLFGVVEEEQLNRENTNDRSEVGDGNEDINDVSNNDDDTNAPPDSNVVTQFFSGTFADLVAGGDLPITFFANSAADGTTVKDSAGNDVRSIGELVQYVFVDSTTIEGRTSSGEEIPGRLIFTLHVNPDGTFTFQLNDQIDHPDQSHDNGTNDHGVFEETLNLDLSNAVAAQDATPDLISFPPGTIEIGVVDDTPIVQQYANEHAVVDEDDIDTGLSQGTSPNDSNADGSFTGNPANNNPGPAFVSGSLADLVSVGADAVDASNHGTFSFNQNIFQTAITNLGFTGLRSHGDLLSYHVDDDNGGVFQTLVAEAGAGEDVRTVFELKLFSDGTYEFRLYDQMDHDPPYDSDPEPFPNDPFVPGDTATADQNTDLIDFDDQPPAQVRNFDINELNFGGLVQFSDYDGDTVGLGANFAIQIRDDIPVLIHGHDGEIKLTVDEDDISTLGAAPDFGSLGTSPNDSNGDGSFTGNPANNNPGPAFVSGTLAGIVVESGADENLTFGFTGNAVSYFLSLGLESQGRDLSFDVDGNILYGFVQNPSGIGSSYDAGTDRLVFTFELTDTSTGDFEFKLFDQLDHDAPPAGTADENFGLHDSIPGDLTYIDFGHALQATDFDGDSVVLEDKLQIRIRDDIPTVHASIVNGSNNVIVDETAGLQNDDTSSSSVSSLFNSVSNKGTDPDMSTQYAHDNSAVVSSTVVAGADEGSTVAWSLTVGGGDGTFSGLQTTAGKNIYLFKQNGMIVGRYEGAAGSDPAESNDVAAFAVHIDNTGHISIAQFVSLKHPNTGSSDEDMFIPAGKILAQVTVTDFDGDVATDTVDISGEIGFSDDGPDAISESDPIGIGSLATGNVITGVDFGGGDANGTDGVADVPGADGAKVSKIVGFGGAFDDSPTSGEFTVAGAFGNLTINENGNYTYTRTSPAGGTDIFTYTLKDGDGDIDTATLTITLDAQNLFIVGSNLDDDATSVAGTTDDHTVPKPGVIEGIIQGAIGNDILVGDPGALPQISDGGSANIVLVLDTSQSMTTNINFGGGSTPRIEAMEDAVKNLLDQLAATGASNIRVHVVQFEIDASAVATFDVTINSVDQSLTTIKNTTIENLDNFMAAGTNYEAGLYEAYRWINGELATDPLPGATVNKVLFVSDGEPNTYMTGEHGAPVVTGAGFSQLALDHATGDAAGDNNTDERAMIETHPNFVAHPFTIEAIGIDLSGLALTRLGVVEGDDGVATSITTAEQLNAAVGEIVGGSEIPSVAGNDVINGDAGNDIIFGDVMNTDALATANALGTPAGSGWSVFASLETSPGNAASDPAGNGLDWTRADTVAYILANPVQLAAEAPRTGGNDTINGGLGNDLIFAQEGNDLITYAIGDGFDHVDGGINPNPTDIDTFEVTGTGAGEVFHVESLAAFNARAVPDYVAPAATQFGPAEIIVSDAAGNIHAALRNIEEIVIHGGGGADTLVVGGSFAATALLASTITFDGGAGDDTLDLTGRASAHRVVANGGSGGETPAGDKAILDFAYSDITNVEVIAGGFKITHDGITDEFTNFENFQFTDVGTLSYTDLLTAPGAPSIDSVIDDVATITGPVANGGVTNDALLSVKVTLGAGTVAGDSVQLFNGVAALGSAVVLSALDITNGYVNITTPALADGATYALNAKTIDVFDNSSAASANHNVTIDTTPPTVTINAVATNDIISIAERDATVTVTGTNEAGSTVTLNGNAVVVDTATTWHYNLSAAEINAFGQGAETLTAVATDAVGNTTNTTRDIIVDTVAPAAATINAVATNDNINIAERDATVTVTGTNEAGSTVTLNGNAVVADTATTWHYNLSAAEINAFGQGAETLTAVATDIAGNTTSSTRDIFVDTVAPAAATINVVATNDIINIAERDATVTVTGTKAFGSFVTLNGNAVVIDSATTWHYDLSAAAINAFGQGAETLTAVASDAAGNTTNTTRNISIDTVRPDATIVVADSNLTVGETSAVTITFTEAVTNFDNTDLTVEGGTLSAVGSVDGGVTWTATFTPTTPLVDASNAITLADAGVNDLVGNAGTGTSVSNNYAINTAAPVNLPPTDIVFTGNSSISVGTSGGDTTVANNTVLFTLSTVDPDDVSGFTYSFNGAGTAAVTVDGDSETFTLNSSTGAVTTTALSYNDPATVTVTTYRSVDNDGAQRIETMTLRLGEDGSISDTLDGSATTNDQVIYGFEGNDILTGGSGNDWISGGDDADTITGGGGADIIDVGGSSGNSVRFTATGDYGDTINSFDSSGGGQDSIVFSSALNTLFDDGTSDDNFTVATGNGGGGAVNADIGDDNGDIEMLLLTGSGGEGVTNANLLDAAAVAAAFNAEFNITASNGNDALLVINDTDGNSSSIWQYTELTGGGEISSGELTFIARVNSDAAIASGNLDLA